MFQSSSTLYIPDLFPHLQHAKFKRVLWCKRKQRRCTICGGQTTTGCFLCHLRLNACTYLKPSLPIWYFLIPYYWPLQVAVPISNQAHLYLSAHVVKLSAPFLSGLQVMHHKRLIFYFHDNYPIGPKRPCSLALA